MRITWPGLVVCLVCLYRVNAQNSSSVETTTLAPTTDYFTATSPSSTTKKPGCTSDSLQPPILVDTDVQKDFVNFTWNVSVLSEKCENVSLFFYCNSEDMPTWIIKTMNLTVPIDNLNGINYAKLEEFSEFTNYTCHAHLENDIKESNATEFNFTTLEGVPSPPANLSVTNIQSTSFYISWAEPEKIPGFFQGYFIRISTISSNHYTPESCEDTFDEEYNITETYFAFEGAFPDYIYNVTVFGCTNAGNGSKAFYEFLTKSSEPEAPQNLNAIIDSTDNGTEVSSNVNITWDTPCRSNGNVEKYYIWLEGIYTEIEAITDSQNVSVDGQTFEATVHNLAPSTNYTIYVRAEITNLLGYNSTTTILTPDNYPGIPQPSMTNITETTFGVTWDEPYKISGKILDYNLTLRSNGPMFITNPSCTYPDNTQQNLIIPSDDYTQYNYTFKNLEPYYSYTFTISARTSAGSGPEYEYNFQTNSTVPEIPQNISYNLVGLNTEEEYSESLNIFWEIPCRLNGNLEKFELSINGTYSENFLILDIRSLNITHNNDDSIRYYTEIDELKASFDYQIFITAVTTDGFRGKKGSRNFKSPVGYPGRPILKPVSFGDDSEYFGINWDEPEEKRGKILNYSLTISSEGPLEVYGNNCEYDKSTHNFTIENNYLEFNSSFAYFKYNVSVWATTERGDGKYDMQTVITPSTVPDSVDIYFDKTSITFNNFTEYDVTANILFYLPCFTNGEIKQITVSYKAHRENCVPVNGSQIFFNGFPPEMSHIIQLEPEYNYEVNVTLQNTVGSNTSTVAFKSPAGVPSFEENIQTTIKPEIEGATQAKISLKKNYFNSTNGEIRYVALIISSDDSTADESDFWDNQTWLEPVSSSAKIYYQITEPFWSPFNQNEEVTVTIGDNKSCTESDRYCNRPLEQDTTYYLIIRVFTNDFYRNSRAIPFKTDVESQLALILGLTFGLLLLAAFALFGFIAWRKQMCVKITSKVLKKRNSVVQEMQVQSSGTAIPISKFHMHCKSLEENPDKLKEEFKLLNEKSEEIYKANSTLFALLPENRRKNRYTNILPYDETRVKLLMDEDDEISSDYINASYISGFSGKPEYIATQGPISLTCKDFWKMVIQEKVKIIVMVSQFVEDNKEKCQRYFPKNHDNLIIDDNIEVRCSTELHFGMYCVRTLQVKKDFKQETVTHMQFLDWPDFGVPVGTENMLQFCYCIREKLNNEGGLAVVHCSAGVGRTGTLIATDILLQVIKSGKCIDVFNTVLKMRSQRKNMVQTEKQYMYIHKLLCDNIKHPITQESEIYSEPLYENLSVFQKSEDNLNLVKDVESKL